MKNCIFSFIFPISVFLKVLRKDAFKDVSYELDNLLGASPASASVLDIIAASANQTFPNAEAGGSEIVGYQLDGSLAVWLVGSLRGSGPGSASVLDIATASASRTLPTMEASAVDAGFSGEDQGTLDASNATSITRQT